MAGVQTIYQKDIGFRPFLRWAGGKQGLVSQLVSHLPPGFGQNGATYFEPFLGAGALFLATLPARAVLSDLNSHLIHCFRAIRDNPGQMYRSCRTHEQKTCRSYYYEVREAFNARLNEQTVAQAARLLYLNRSCFNGIFRVNTDGEYNVPFGNKPRLLMPTLRDFRALSNALSQVSLECRPYDAVLDWAKPGDFIYLDPPYPPLNGTSYFTHYTKERFSETDQRHVGHVARELTSRGCLVMISNADTPAVRGLYSKWRYHVLPVRRYVSCKSQRQEVKETIICNYGSGRV